MENLLYFNTHGQKGKDTNVCICRVSFSVRYYNFTFQIAPYCNSFRIYSLVMVMEKTLPMKPPMNLPESGSM